MAADFGPVGKASVEIGAALGPLRKGLEQARTMMRTAIAPVRIAFRVNMASIRAAQAAAQNLASALQRTLAAATSPIGLIGAGIGALGLKEALAGPILAASDLGEAISKATTVYGASVGTILDESMKLSRRFGINRKEFIDAAVNLGRFGLGANLTARQSAELGVRLGKLGADLASFDNIPIEDAFQRLQSGLAGEAEPLRRHGVLLSEARVEQEAYTAGIVRRGQALTEAQKVMARSLVIQKDLAAATGDLERTSGSFSNQLRMMQGRVGNLAAAFGEALLPAATSVVRALAAGFERMTAAIQAARPAIEAFATRIGDGFKLVFAAATELPTAFELLRTAAQQAGQQVGAIFSRLSWAIQTTIGDAFQYGIGIVGNFLHQIRTVVDAVVAAVAEAVPKIRDALMLAFIGGDVAGELMKVGAAMGTTIGEAAGKALTADLSEGLKAPSLDLGGLFDGLPGQGHRIDELLDKLRQARGAIFPELPTRATPATEPRERRPLPEDVARFAGRLNRRALARVGGDVPEPREPSPVAVARREQAGLRQQMGMIRRRMGEAMRELRSRSARNEILNPQDATLERLGGLERSRQAVRERLAAFGRRGQGQGALMPVGTNKDFENGRPMAMGLEEFAKKSMTSGFVSSKVKDPIEDVVKNTARMLEKMDKLILEAGKPRPAVVY